MTQAAADFDSLVEEFYRVWLRFHPDAALAAGFGGYEGLLPAVDDDETGALVGWLESLIIGLEELDYAALDPDRQLDLQWLFGAAQSEHYGLLERDWRHRDPLGYLPFHHIFNLTLDTPEKLRARLGRLLAAVPEYLRHARGQLCSVPELIPPPLLYSALDLCKSGSAYLRRLGSSLIVKRYCNQAGNIRGLCEAAAEAVDEYSGFLAEYLLPCAQGGGSVGGEAYQRLLKHNHFMDFSLAAARELLDALYEEARDELTAGAQHFGLSPDPASVRAFLREQHRFEGEARLQVYREESNRLRQFVDQRGLYTSPAVPLRLVERPICPHPGRCADDYVRQRTPEGSVAGVFYIASDSATTGEPRAMIRSRCFAATWTGDHLLSWPAAGPVSLVRQLRRSQSFALSWGLYIRELLADQGYLSGEDRLQKSLLQLNCLCQARADLALHIGEWDIKQTRAALAEVGPGTEGVDQSLVSILRNPSDRLAGVLGWRLLRVARQQAVSSSSEFDLSGFHDGLLEQGPVPVPLLLQKIHGREFWDQASVIALSQSSS